MDRKKKNILELTRVGVDEYREMPKVPLSVMADNVRSAQNIGSLMRTADAFMLREVVMAGISAVPPNAEISKTALGAELSVEWRHVPDALAEVMRMQAEGVKVLVLEQTHDSVSLENLKSKIDNLKPTAREGYLLVVGNEVKGVDQRIVDVADMTVEIPMHGVKHSLNVSVSAGIAMWEIFKILEF